MDRAYEGDKTRELCRSLGHEPIVPPKKNHLNPWEYDHGLYKKRNIIERLFRWLKEFRRVCTRYDKRDLVFLSFIQLGRADTNPKAHLFGRILRILRR